VKGKKYKCKKERKRRSDGKKPITIKYMVVVLEREYLFKSCSNTIIHSILILSFLPSFHTPPLSETIKKRENEES
jgi:hypothetical protein